MKLPPAGVGRKFGEGMQRWRRHEDGEGDLMEYESGENRSDPNDEDFEIEDDSVRKGFEQHELNDFVRDLGLSKKEPQSC
ncbi:hypothetical protein AVEN_21474-1 [Araneus ventricosus]|uniref:Uncharacterized protein n=1 Tax=Araneus ventricosus TaxID=182803 RepID=A0A4Y2ER06_ARAVE|nr:hypothetical protein AVEN_21474-1 [Araneus ventricosus]